MRDAWWPGLRERLDEIDADRANGAEIRAKREELRRLNKGLRMPDWLFKDDDPMPRVARLWMIVVSFGFGWVVEAVNGSRWTFPVSFVVVSAAVILWYRWGARRLGWSAAQPSD